MTTPFPLGRLLRHDPRSLEYPAEQLSVVTSKSWRHHGPILDQLDLRACTGNAMAQCLNTVPFYSPYHLHDETDAVRLYSKATTLDDTWGSYPPNDTGSSGIAVAQAAKQFGYINSYRHAFGLDHALGALMLSPMIIGTNWYSDMFNPDSYGFVRPTGNLVGGHEYLLVGVNATGHTLAFVNSWSSSWGRSGYFYMTFASFTTLLNQDGDVTVPSL